MDRDYTRATGNGRQVVSRVKEYIKFAPVNKKVKGQGQSSPGFLGANDLVAPRVSLSRQLLNGFCSKIAREIVVGIFSPTTEDIECILTSAYPGFGVSFVCVKCDVHRLPFRIQPGSPGHIFPTKIKQLA